MVARDRQVQCRGGFSVGSLRLESFGKASVILAGLSIGLFLLYQHSSLWFDEAGQFWISQGLNHDSPPLSPSGDINEVLLNNRLYNLDPGGFSILLHLWIKLSTSVAWLRLLPYIFFCLGVFSFLALLRFLSLNRLSFATVPILFFLTPFSEILLFIRPHSMEFGIALFTLYLVIRFRESLNFKLFWFINFNILVLYTTRYDGIIIGICLSLSLTVLLRQSALLKIRHLIIPYSLQFSLTVGVYLHMTIFQNSSAEPLNYLSYIGSSPELVLRKRNLVYLGFLVLFLIRLIKNRTLFNFQTSSDLVLVVCVLTNAVTILLSVAEKLPWDPFSRQNPCLLAIFLLGLFCEMKRLLANRPVRFLHSRYAYSIGFFCIIILVVIGKQVGLLALPSNFGSSDIRRFLESEKIQREIAQGQRILVSGWEAPGLRYLIEESSLWKGFKNSYPENFVLVEGGFHTLEVDKRLEQKPINFEEFNILLGSEYTDTVRGNKEWILIGTDGLVAVRKQ